VLSVLATVQYSYLEKNETRSDFASPVLNIFQVTLESIVIKLRDKHLLKLTHIEHMLGFIQQGKDNQQHHKRAHGGTAVPFSNTFETILADFYALFPLQSRSLASKCFSNLLSGDVFDIIFQVLDEEASKIGSRNSRFYMLVDSPSIERFCLKCSQHLSLHPLDKMASWKYFRPETLFHVAMVLFIAEDFEGLMVIQSVLLDMLHPAAAYNFTRVFSVCFASDSFAFQVAIVKELCGTSTGVATTDASDSPQSKRRRLRLTNASAFMPRETFLHEPMSLLKLYSLEKLVHLAKSLSSSGSSKNGVAIKSIQHGHTKALDLSGFSNNGIIPAALTVTAEDNVAQLDMSHNQFASFPLMILDISCLLRLDLSWNMLSSMPSAMDQLINLQVLKDRKNAPRGQKSKLTKC
jgi:hypothetical protein